MGIEAASIGKLIWVVGIVAWYVVRYPFERRARRVRIIENRRSFSDIIGLALALTGLAVLPAIYVASGIPAFADYQARAWSILLGAIAFVTALWVFRRSHKVLGRNWSITLEIRERHELINDGPY